MLRHRILRNSLLLGLGALASLTATADVLTPEQALARVADWRTAPAALRGRVGQAASTPLRPVLTATAPGSDLAAVYGFNLGGSDGGWLLVGADTSAAPVLGWSETGSLADGDIPCGMACMLEGYSRRIEWARANGVEAYAPQARAAADRQPIVPMCTTQWDQKTPYNNLTPVGTNDGFGHDIHCYTGCQATSMAQVMKYYGHPAKGSGSVSYVSDMAPSYMFPIDFNFGETEFRWADMLDTYTGSYTDAQADAVATLMLAAGASVHMLYSPYVSAAYSSYVPYGMWNYLGYNKGASCVMRDYYYPADGWDDFVYDNLSKYGPLLYSGISTTGGHAFVCDGYQAEGYFHFNWGWSGTSDGYYLLDALAPGQQGSGGSSGAAYNFDQDIIAGLNPVTGPNDCLAPSIVGYYVTDGNGEPVEGYYNALLIDSFTPGKEAVVEGTIANMVNYTVPMQLALRFSREDDEAGAFVCPMALLNIDTTDEGVTYDVAANLMTLESMRFANFRATLTMPQLTEGKWTVTPMFRMKEGDSFGSWQQIRWALATTGHYWVWVDANGDYEIDNVEARLDVTDFLWADDHSPADNRYYVSYTFRLTALREAFEGSVYAILYRSGFTTEMARTSTAVDIARGETVEVAQNMSSNRIVNNKDYYVMLYSDPNGNDPIGGPYTFTSGTGPHNAIETVTADGSAAPARWYTLQGVSLGSKPSVPGTYVRVQNGNASKVVL